MELHLRSILFLHSLYFSELPTFIQAIFTRIEQFKWQLEKYKSAKGNIKLIWYSNVSIILPYEHPQVSYNTYSHEWSNLNGIWKVKSAKGSIMVTLAKRLSIWTHQIIRLLVPYWSWHLPRASPTWTLSPRRTKNSKSDEEFPFFCDIDVGAWKTSTTVDPMLNAATWSNRQYKNPEWRKHK